MQATVVYVHVARKWNPNSAFTQPADSNVPYLAPCKPISTHAINTLPHEPPSFRVHNQILPLTPSEKFAQLLLTKHVYRLHDS